MPYFQNDQHRLFYREQGQGDLLLILPGNTASSVCHGGELSYFGQQRHAVSMDFWGTGQSDRLDEFPPDWWDQGAHDAAALIDHLVQDRAIIMGTSGGAISALLAAIHHPEKVKAVVADSVAASFTPEKLRSEVAERQKRTAEQISFWSYAQGEDWEKVVEADSEFLLELAEAGGDLYHNRLYEIRCPVLFTASLADTAIPDVDQQIISMVAQIPHSRAYFAQEGGHPMMWSRPEEFRQAADLFMKAIEEEF